jgi:hypothetical protein
MHARRNATLTIAIVASTSDVADRVDIATVQVACTSLRKARIHYHWQGKKKKNPMRMLH